MALLCFLPDPQQHWQVKARLLSSPLPLAPPSPDTKEGREILPVWRVRQPWEEMPIAKTRSSPRSLPLNLHSIHPCIFFHYLFRLAWCDPGEWWWQKKCCWWGWRYSPKQPFGYLDQLRALHEVSWVAMIFIDTIVVIMSNCCDTGVGPSENWKPCLGNKHNLWNIDLGYLLCVILGV